jgi:hypothetical protein
MQIVPEDSKSVNLPRTGNSSENTVVMICKRLSRSECGYKQTATVYDYVYNWINKIKQVVEIVLRGDKLISENKILYLNIITPD